MDGLQRIPLDPRVSAPVYHIASTPSTNSMAVELIADQATPTPHMTTVVAAEQTAGRGRLTRTWTSAPGKGLTATTVLSLPTSLALASSGWLIHACALAVRDAVDARLAPLGRTVHTKWPNDVCVDGKRKICGILGEVAPASSPFVNTFVIGYGVNISMADDERPTPEATALSLEGDQEAAASPRDTALALLADILVGLDRRVTGLINADGDPIASGLAHEATTRCITIGSRIGVADPTDPTGAPQLKGTATALSPIGTLVVLLDDGTTTDVSAGDVTPIANGKHHA